MTPKFKVGDKVKVIGKDSYDSIFFNGKIGTIIEDNYNYYHLDITRDFFKEGKTYTIHGITVKRPSGIWEKELELYTEQKKKVKEEFKVGDKVIVTNPTTGMSITTKGSIGTIIEFKWDQKNEITVDFESYGSGEPIDKFITTIWTIPKNSIELYKKKEIIDSPVEKIEAKPTSIWGDW